MENEVTMEIMRSTIQALGDGDKEISYPLLYDALGVTEDAVKDTVRSRINKMVKHGELIRTERGSFIYNFKRRPRNAKIQEIVWRFVRASKPGWTVQDCSLMTHASYTYALRYITWLEDEGFVKRSGTNERNATMFRATEKARSHPETPFPPIRPADPFAKERVAAATITRLMLCADPYSVKTAREIREACRILLTRFEKINAENRMENENEEE